MGALNKEEREGRMARRWLAMSFMLALAAGASGCAGSGPFERDQARRVPERPSRFCSAMRRTFDPVVDGTKKGLVAGAALGLWGSMKMLEWKWDAEEREERPEIAGTDDAFYEALRHKK